MTGENESAAIAQSDAAESSGVTADQRADQRMGQRFTLMLRFAKIRGAQGEFLCVLRNVSARGVSAKLFHPLSVTGPVEIEMPNGDCHRADMVWQREDKAGFSFHKDTDLARLIEGQGAYPRRGMRVTLSLPVELSFDGKAVPAEIHNLSQQGALITCEEHLPLMQNLMLRNPMMPEIRAKVRWRKDGESGLVFDDTFQYADLARLVDELQRNYVLPSDDPAE